MAMKRSGKKRAGGTKGRSSASAKSPKRGRAGSRASASKRSSAGGSAMKRRGGATKRRKTAKRRTSSTAMRKTTSKRRTTATTRASGSKARRSTSSRSTGKVGSNPRAATQFAERTDFGIPEQDAIQPDTRAATANRTRLDVPPRSGEDGDRTSGVGGSEAGPGSSSGGDLDPEFVGLDGKGGLAQSVPTRVTGGPASSTGTSAEFASGPPARGDNPRRDRENIQGSTVDRGGGDESTSGGSPDQGGADDIQDDFT